MLIIPYYYLFTVLIETIAANSLSIKRERSKKENVPDQERKLNFMSAFVSTC